MAKINVDEIIVILNNQIENTGSWWVKLRNKFYISMINKIMEKCFPEN